MPDSPQSTPPASDFKGKEIIVGVCGGIAAYKVCDLVSKLVQRGAGVTVVMTPDATKFVSPITFQALSGRAVRVDPWDLSNENDPQHISLTEKADLMLIAPATAHTIAKIAHGFTDDLISLLVNASACPVVFAPAMNNRMWANPITQDNVRKLRRLGYEFIGPADGWLACRNTGPGRMTEPSDILAELETHLRPDTEVPAPRYDI